MEHITNLVLSNKDKHELLACNMPAKSQSTIFVYSSEMVKELLLQDESIQKMSLVGSVTKMTSFFFRNGEEAFKVKALFTKMFSYDSLGLLHESISELISRYIQEFNAKEKLSKTDIKSVNLKAFFGPLMAAVANHVILGGSEIELSLQVQEINSLMTVVYAGIYEVLQNPLFTLIPNVAEKLGLIKAIKVLDRSAARLNEIVAEILAEREKRTELGDCILDRIIKHNRECKSKGELGDILQLKEISGLYFVFLFAGTDTSMVNTLWTLTHIADKPSIQDQINDIANEVFDSQGNTTRAKVEGNERIEMLAKETLRLFSPVQRQLSRVLTKDIKLGKYHLRKGDYVTILYSALHRDPDHWTDPDTFNLDRFTKATEKNLPKYQVLPFSIGRRVCMGRYMGEMMIKLLITTFVKSYEISKPENHEYYNLNLLTCETQNPLVNLRIRK